MTIAPRFERVIARGLGSSSLARAALSLVLSGCALIGGAGAANASANPASAHGNAIFGAGLTGSSTIHVATDPDQNIVVAGSFEGVLELGGARLISQDESDIFVAKLNSAGKLVWAERVGGAGTQHGLAVATDLDGNIVVTGSTRAPVAQGGQAPSSQIFVAKLDASGQQVFAMSFGHMHTGIGLGAAISERGEITVVGRFSGIARFDDFAIKSSPDAPNGDAIVLRLAPNGRVLWGHALGGLGEQYAGAVAAAPDGGVVLSGLFSGTLELDGKQHTSTGTPSAFVVAMDDLGSVRFSRNLGPSLGDIPRLAVDPSGAVVVAGTYHGRIELDAGTLLSAGEDDVFALKLDASGAPVFLRGFGDAGSQQLGGVAVDAQGGIALAMSSLGNVDLGAGPIEGHGGYDVALVKLDALGAPQWGTTFGDHHDQLASDVVIDAAGNIVLAGQFAGSIDLGGGALQATAGFDAFLGSLAP
jgi:hypothetical protein